MDSIADRHAGTLDDRLAPLDAAPYAVVVVTVPAAVAHLPSCQHTVWMLANLLTRAVGIVAKIVVECPMDVALAGRIVPLAPRDLDLSAALARGTACIGGVPVLVVPAADIESADFRFVVGPGPARPGYIRVHGERWWGGFSTGEVPGGGRSTLPFGPYVAACLAASEVFKAIRLHDYRPLNAVFYSSWNLTARPEPDTDADWIGPAEVGGLPIAATLAGVGAVGSTWVHALWATEGIAGSAVIADADKFGVDRTNLNRCPIFGTDSLGQQKASEAAQICGDASLTWHSHDGPVGSAPDRLPLLVSAVDTNASRQSVQQLYPARLLSASTLGLRAEVLRCDPTGGAPCIHCFNPIEAAGPDDDELRRRFRGMTVDEQHQLASELGVDLDEAVSWATEGTCGYAGDQVAGRLRGTAVGAEAFAVGFVSVMAGTLAAAITIQESMGTPRLAGTLCTARFTFLDPLFARNAPIRCLRQAACAMCDPDTPAGEIWRDRYAKF
jgi:hypothetical protein